MPIDPNIYFNRVAPAPGAQHYANEYLAGQGQGIQNAIHQAQLGQMQQQQADEQALRRSMVVDQNGNVDRQATLRNLAGLQNPMAVASMQQKWALADQEQARSQASILQARTNFEKEMREADSAKRVQEHNNLQEFTRVAHSVLNGPPEQFTQRVQQTIQRFDPDGSKGMAQYAQGLTPQALNTLMASAEDHKTWLENNFPREKWQRVETSTGFAGYDPTTNTMKPVETNLKPKIPAAIQIHNLGGGPRTPNRTLVGEDALGSMSKPRAALIKAIVMGAEEAPSSRSKTWESTMQDVLAVDPGWTRQRAQIRKALTTGKEGANIGSLNTAAVHLGDLIEAGEALKNGTFRPGNALYQRMSEMFGHPMPTSYETFKTVSSGELANALKGSATDVEIHSIKQVLDRSMSPDQLSASAKGYLKTLNQKLKTYEERYKKEVPDDTWSPILPSAKEVFDRYGASSQSKIGTASMLNGWLAKNPGKTKADGIAEMKKWGYSVGGL